jgi:hypothetical protein
MINVKIYIPLQDNDGKCVIEAHTDFLEDIKHMPKLVEVSRTSRLIEGFTITEAIGHWFDDDKHYIDNQRIYEFHLSETVEVRAIHELKIMCQKACTTARQECIYMTIDNEQHYIGEAN